jgi:hypothetical protein
MTFPIPPEAITSAIELYAAAKAIGIGADFFKVIFSEPGKDLSEILAHYSTRRLKNFLKVGQRSEQMLADAGKVAQSPPLRTLQPILDGAANEESPDMQELWAALLANASTTGAAVSPLYPRILANLSPASARILRAIYVSARATNRGFAPYRDGEPEREGSAQSSIEFLIRNPSEETEESAELARAVPIAVSELVSVGVLEIAPPDVKFWADMSRPGPHEYRISAMGMAFLRACEPPTRPVSNRDEQPSEP